MGECYVFRSRCSSNIRHRTHGVELGAGDGRWANALIEMRRIRILAVDVLPKPKKLRHEITWVQMDVRDWLRRLDPFIQFDFITSFNLIHFLPREYVLRELLPELAVHVRPGGFMATRTFYRKPDPEPKENGYRSLYTPGDIVAALPNRWRVSRAYRDQDRARTPSDTVKRNWFITDVLAHCP